MQMTSLWGMSLDNSSRIYYEAIHLKNRFKNNLYTIEDIKYIDGHHQYVINDDGTLFSGPYRTKIKPKDLPE